MKIESLLKLVLFYWIVGWLISCSDKKKSVSYEATKLTDTLLSKTISFPEKFPILGVTLPYIHDSIMHEILQSKKIISVIDGTCMACITDQLNALDSLFSTIIEDKNCKVIFVMNLKKVDSVYFMLNLKPAIRAKGVIFLDDEYLFERSNKILTSHSHLRTFMTDIEGKIELYGNPLEDTELIVLYKNKLK